MFNSNNFLGKIGSGKVLAQHVLMGWGAKPWCASHIPDKFPAKLAPNLNFPGLRGIKMFVLTRKCFPFSNSLSNHSSPAVFLKNRGSFVRIPFQQSPSGQQYKTKKLIMKHPVVFVASHLRKPPLHDFNVARMRDAGVPTPVPGVGRFLSIQSWLHRSLEPVFEVSGVKITA